MILNNSIRKRILSIFGNKKTYQLFNQFKTKFNKIRNLHNQMCGVTLNPDMQQRQEELRKLYEAYNRPLYLKNRHKNLTKRELIDFLGISPSLADGIITLLAKQMDAKNIPSYYLKQNIDLLKKYNVDIGSNNIKTVGKIIEISPFFLEARLEMMKEATIPLTFSNMKRIPYIGRIRMRELELSKIIQPNLPLTIFTKLHAPKHILNSLPLCHIYQQWKFAELWVHLLEIFFKWKMHPQDANWKRVISRIGKLYNSLSSMNKNIDLLRNKMKFSSKKILIYPNTLTCCTSNLKLYCDDPDPEIRNFIVKLPDIVLRPYEETKQVLSMLHFVSWNKPLLDVYYRNFLLDPNVVLNRLKKLLNATSLTDLRLTPRATNLIYHVDEYLEKLRQDFADEEVKCFPCVRRLEIADGRYYNKKVAVLLFLKEILKLSIKNEDLKLMNMIHLPELPCIKKNFVFLYQKGFSCEELQTAFQILLFPNNILVEIYTEMQECPYATEFKGSNDKNKLLQLLLYYTSIHYKEIGGSY